MVQWLYRLTRLIALWRVLFYGCAAFILYLATTPLDYPIPSSSWDKLNHAMAFAVLAGLLSLAHRALGPLRQGLALLGYGLLIEIWQAFLPLRECDLADLAADGVGLAVGLGVMAMFWLWLDRHPATNQPTL
ncbi:VanZ family protein [Marinobacteraceae bacterium S3BR75-40.1]